MYTIYHIIYDRVFLSKTDFCRVSFFPTGGAIKSLNMLLFFYLVFLSMCNFRIHWWLVWSVCVHLCLPPWSLQEDCCWPAGPAGPAGL